MPLLWERRWGMCVAFSRDFLSPRVWFQTLESKCCQVSTWESCPSSPNVHPDLVGQSWHGEWDTLDTGKMAESGSGAPGDRGALRCRAILRHTGSVCCFHISWWLIFLQVLVCPWKGQLSPLVQDKMTYFNWACKKDREDTEEGAQEASCGVLLKMSPKDAKNLIWSRAGRSHVCYRKKRSKN